MFNFPVLACPFSACGGMSLISRAEICRFTAGCAILCKLCLNIPGEGVADSSAMLSGPKRSLQEKELFRR